MIMTTDVEDFFAWLDRLDDTIDPFQWDTMISHCESNGLDTAKLVALTFIRCFKSSQGSSTIDRMIQINWTYNSKYPRYANEIEECLAKYLILI